MGSGIAQVAAMCGKRTIQFDVNPEMLQKSRKSIEAGLDFLVQKGKINALQKEAITGRIFFTADIADCVADLVIEAIVESKEAKTTLFHQLSSVNSSSTIFATNTSSISINELAETVPHPSQVIGMHFFNPAPVMKLVEVVKGRETGHSVVEAITTLTIAMGKIPVVCKDSPGFIVNRVARPYYLEAMKLIEEGLTTIETVDAVMEASVLKWVRLD